VGNFAQLLQQATTTPATKATTLWQQKEKKGKYNSNVFLFFHFVVVAIFHLHSTLYLYISLFFVSLYCDYFAAVSSLSSSSHEN